MTAWQTIEIDGESVLNDHTNKDYDDRLIDRLGSLHERAEGDPPPTRRRPAAPIHLCGETRRRAGEGRGRRDRVGERRQDRVLPHGVVRAARGPAADPRPHAPGIGGWTPAAGGLSPSTAAHFRIARIVGGKAWGIAFMRHAGLPVPPAFVVTTEACRAYLAEGALPDGLLDEMRAGIATLEAETGRRFGSDDRPLLLAIRSGAAISMPGMLDTVLNLGMSEEIETALARESGDTAFARDTHRRFYRDVRAYRAQGRHRPAPARGHRGGMAKGRRGDRGRGEACRVAPADQLEGAVSCGLRFVERAACEAVSAASRAPGRRGHGRHGSGHGVR